MKKYLLNFRQLFLGILFIPSLLSSVCSVNAQTAGTIGQTVGGPSGITVDGSDLVYIAERAPTQKVSKLNQSTGIITTFSNSGIVDPMGLAVGPSNDIYVADYGGNKILRIPASGGAAIDYVTGAAGPAGLCFDLDTLYFIEYFTQKIYKVKPGGGAVGSSNITEITSATSMWIGLNARGLSLTLLTNGNLFVTAGLHYYQYEINKTTGTIINIVSGDDNIIFGSAQLSDGNVYMPGNATNKLYVWQPSTTTDNVAYFGNGTVGSIDGTGPAAAFDSPYFMAKDGNDNLYVTDYNTKKIRKVTNAMLAVEKLDKETISIFPNPTSSILSIQLKTVGTISILSADGRIIDEIHGASHYTVDATSFENGVYFIKTENGTTQKFIKQ